MRESIASSASSTLSTVVTVLHACASTGRGGGCSLSPVASGGVAVARERKARRGEELAWSKRAPPLGARRVASRGSTCRSSAGFARAISPLGEVSEGAAEAPSDCLVTGVREVDDGLELAEEPAPAEHEKPEEPGRDREVAGAEREPSARGHRREDDEDTLEEDRHETEHGDHDQRSVPLGRPAGEALEQVRQRDQPADDQHEPRQREPRLGEEAREKKARLHGDVAVPDHEVLGPEEVHPHDRDRELELRDVLHGGGWDRGVSARVRADRQERQEAEPYIKGADDEVPPEPA